MRKYDFEESVGYWICVTSHIYQRRIDRELTPLGVTFRQFQVLGWLVLEGELSQAELAERLTIEAPTLVRILDRMQKQGLVARRADEADRRRNQIVVGPQATPVWNKVIDVLNRVREEATASMTQDEVATLQKLLQRVQSNLAEISPPDAEADARSASPSTPHGVTS